MTEYLLTVDEFVEQYARTEIERSVDAQILAEPDHQDRLLLMRHRGQIIGKMVDACKIRNLEHRLAEAEARPSLRVVDG